ncbi:MAG: protein O-mannosyl-transferase family, partial [Candidatus Levyibacteriota bacterium]
MKQKSQRFSWKSFLLPFALFIFTFCVYLHNLSQSVYGGDVGDLLSAIVVKGVAHPSGYPFFIILGIFANSIPVMMTTAGKVGLVSVFFSSVSVVIFYFTVLLLTQKKYISFISALTLAFFYMFWLYAEIAEVFALASFFVEILVFLALLYYKKRKTVYLYFFSFFLGVSLTHHEIIIATFPSLFFIILATKWKIIREWKTILFCILFGALGLFPFLYIPLAASGHPIINWDNATTLQN